MPSPRCSTTPTSSMNATPKRAEGRPLELWLDAPNILMRGADDCEGLACFLAAEMRVRAPTSETPDRRPAAAVMLKTDQAPWPLARRRHRPRYERNLRPESTTSAWDSIEMGSTQTSANNGQALWAVVGLGAVAATGVVIAQSMTSTTTVIKPSKDTGPDIEPDKVEPDKDPTSTGPHPTIGRPFRPGFPYEAANAATACKHRPIVHPAGVAAASSGMTLDDWLATVAFLETYPNAPVHIGSLRAKPLQTAWLRIRGYVRACLRTPDKDPDTQKDTDPSKDDVGPKLHPTLGPPYGVGRGSEKRNVELACERKPVHFIDELIDYVIWQYLGNKDDGMGVDSSAY